jgi:phage terminase large subunit-like protein
MDLLDPIQGVTDDTWYPIIYAAPPEADWKDEEVWRSCNPALGDFLQWQYLRDEFRQAQRIASKENAFKRLYLNQWTQQETRWIQLEQWDKCAGAVDLQALKYLPCYAGLDLSTTTDITALVLVFVDGNGFFHVVPYFWMPEAALDHPALSGTEKSRRRQYIDSGLMAVTPGNVIDYGFIRHKINELGQQFRIGEIAIDRWNATQISVELGNDGFTVFPMGQGFASMSAPAKELEHLILDAKLRHGGNPVLRWMADCVSVMQDASGNIKPVKPDRIKSGKRIDGIVALTMAVDRAVRNEQGPSIYESRGMLVV